MDEEARRLIQRTKLLPVEAQAAVVKELLTPGVFRAAALGLWVVKDGCDYGCRVRGVYLDEVEASSSARAEGCEANYVEAGEVHEIRWCHEAVLTLAGVLIERDHPRCHHLGLAHGQAEARLIHARRNRSVSRPVQRQLTGTFRAYARAREEAREAVTAMRSEWLREHPEVDPVTGFPREVTT